MATGSAESSTVAADAPQVRIAEGLLRGRVWDGCDAFLGVPFAAAPTGARRFAPPEQPASWQGIRRADAFGFAAPQPDRPMGIAMHGPTPATDEDCLTLNIWRPRARAAGAGPTTGAGGDKLPVVVWFHGGGWALGFGSQPGTQGARLAQTQGCAVITVNYRLGSLGWLHHPDLAAQPGAPCGNWGLLDHVAALRWVGQNADALGLDADRITIAGHSAGALAVLNLLVAPAAKGLFHQAIIQSGPVRDATIDPAEAVHWATELSQSLGGDGFDPAVLRAATVAEILEAHEHMHHSPPWKGGHGGAVPCIDPATIPVRVADAPAASPSVPVLIGYAAQEGTFRMLPNPDLQLDQETIDAGTERRFAGPISEWSAARAAAGSRVHRYRIDLPAVDPRLGATHGVEIPLVFGTYATDPTAHALVGDGSEVVVTSRAMMSAWGGFITGGDPGWSPLDGGPGAEQQAVFGGPDGVHIQSIQSKE